MGTPRICIIHDSERIRETIAIVLEGRAQIAVLDTTDVASAPKVCADADMVIATADLPFEQIQWVALSQRVLWLTSRLAQSTPTTSGLSRALSASFTPNELIHCFEQLLESPLRTTTTRAGSLEAPIVDYPLIAHNAIILMRCAQETDLAVLICGEAGSGKSRVARAIHNARPDRDLIRIASGLPVRAQVNAAMPGTHAATLLVQELLSLDGEDLSLLMELLDTGVLPNSLGLPVRLICSTSAPYDQLTNDPRLPRTLLHRLGVLTISLLPLRERGDDLEALLQFVAARTTRALGRPIVSFTPAALTRLQRYLWFGNLAEFESVITRSIALAASTTLDLCDLRFDFAQTPTVSVAITQPPPPKLGESEASRAADVIIQELAHEFKNPLVAIKTVTQQLDYFARDEAGRKQAAKLAGDAVDRMDHALDNLVQYSQFTDPQPRPVPLLSLVTAAIDAVSALVVERDIAFDTSNLKSRDPQMIEVDATQVSYALENLLRAVLRDVDNGRTVILRNTTADATLEVEFPKGGLQISKRLAELIGHSANGHEAAEPLGYVMARSLIERNAGQLEIAKSETTGLIRVHLPLGTTPRSMQESPAPTATERKLSHR